MGDVWGPERDDRVITFFDKLAGCVRVRVRVRVCRRVYLARVPCV
jgi:hypothetical protein